MCIYNYIYYNIYIYILSIIYNHQQIHPFILYRKPPPSSSAFLFLAEEPEAELDEEEEEELFLVVPSMGF